MSNAITEIYEVTNETQSFTINMLDGTTHEVVCMTKNKVTTTWPKGVIVYKEKAEETLNAYIKHNRSMITVEGLTIMPSHIVSYKAKSDPVKSTTKYEVVFKKQGIFTSNFESDVATITKIDSETK